MKLRDAFAILGFRNKPHQYGFEIKSFDLSKEGRVDYAQWLHPAESKKEINQPAVDEIRKFLCPGDVAIDIGAHTGDSTIPIALAAGKEGCVLALEPNPYVFPVLSKNSELNQDKTKIIPLMFAATAMSGDIRFEYSDEGFCNGGFHEGISQWRHGHAYKLTVRGENLEEYLKLYYGYLIPRIRYIKVDAEGHDYSILQSLYGLIAAQQPYLKCEIYKHLNLEKRKQFFDFLKSFSYEVHRIESDSSYRGEFLTPEKLKNWRHYDIFCVPK